MNWMLPAAASGVLLGMAYPPAGLAWLIWIALVPLLWALHGEQRKVQAFLTGFLTGVIFYLIVTRPLVSAHLWAGWQAASPEELEGQRSTQFIVLNGLWLVLSIWGAFFWGVFGLILSRLANGNLTRIAVLAPPLLIILTEWLRSLTSWGYHWAFLGNATIDVAGVVQLSALGGVWLLSWLVVLINVGVLSLISLITRPRKWLLPVGISGVTVVALSVGLWRAESVQSRLSHEESITVAALQFHQDQYTFDDYTPLGLERAYLELTRQVARGDAGDVELLVLPESIAFGALSLDGSRTEAKPAEAHQTVGRWTEVMSRVIAHSDSRFAIILGLDTVEQGELFNSLVFWTGSGIENWYHKQRPVPFAEYQPVVLSWLGMRGRTEYNAGSGSQIGALHGIGIGGFICQEVLIPDILRQSTRDGAQLLVSGGNDGVFASSAVAQVHADLARLRAVETGRYIVRAMKTGISAIISPTGVEIARSPSSDPFVVVDRVQPLNELTPYVRFGDWPLAFALAFVLCGVVAPLRRRFARDGALRNFRS